MESVIDLTYRRKPAKFDGRLPRLTVEQRAAQKQYDLATMGDK
jgi:hypothetical protein